MHWFSVRLLGRMGHAWCWGWQPTKNFATATLVGLVQGLATYVNTCNLNDMRCC